MADLIVANRVTDDIKNIKARVFTRDLFGSDNRWKIKTKTGQP